MVINKIDLIGTSDFSLERVKENAFRINPNLKVFETSCRSGAGLEEWYSWLIELVEKSSNFENSRDLSIN